MFSAFTARRSRCSCIPDPDHQHMNPIESEDACSKAGEWLMEGELMNRRAVRDQECVQTELEFSPLMVHNT